MRIWRREISLEEWSFKLPVIEIIILVLHSMALSCKTRVKQKDKENGYLRFIFAAHMGFQTQYTGY